MNSSPSPILPKLEPEMLSLGVLKLAYRLNELGIDFWLSSAEIL